MAQITAPVFDPQDIQQNKTMAGLAFLGILFFLPLVSCPNSAFGRWAANQGLLVLLASIVVSLINIIPLLGQIIYLVLSLLIAIFAIISMVGAFQGQAKPIPVIGGISIIK